MNNESMKSTLLQGEQLIGQTFGAIQPPVMTQAANIYLTNQRIIIEANEMAQSIAPNWPANKAVNVTTASFNYVDIKTVTPDKYHLFGFIPTRNTAIVIELKNGERLTLLTEERDKFIKILTDAVAAQVTAPPTSP
jgi:hypothetical protein